MYKNRAPRCGKRLKPDLVKVTGSCREDWKRGVGKKLCYRSELAAGGIWEKDGSLAHAPT